MPQKSHIVAAISITAILTSVSCSEGQFNANTPSSKSKTAEPARRPMPDENDATAVTQEPKAKEPETPIVWPKCMTPDVGVAAATVQVKGENWPGNSVDRGGADYDDYFVIITGKFRVDGYQIFSLEDQDISVDYSLGTPGSTTQIVSLQMVDCDHKATLSEDVSRGSGKKTLTARRGDRFNLYTTANTSGSIRKFDLIKDNSEAYRVNIQN